MFIATARSLKVFRNERNAGISVIAKRSLLQSKCYKHAAPNGAGAAKSANNVGLTKKFTLARMIADGHQNCHVKPCRDCSKRVAALAHGQ